MLIEVANVTADVLQRVHALAGAREVVDRLEDLLGDTSRRLVHLDVHGREPVAGEPLQASPRRPVGRLVKHRLQVDLCVVHLLGDAIKLVLDLPEVVLELLRVEPELIGGKPRLLPVLHLAEHPRIDFLDLMRVTTELVVVDPKVKLLLVGLLLHVAKRVTQVLFSGVEVPPHLLLVDFWFNRVLIPVAVGTAHLAADVALSFIPEVLRLRANLQADSTD